MAHPNASSRAAESHAQPTRRTALADRTAAASVRRVLVTLIAGGLTALALLGLGIDLAHEDSARTLTSASADRWTTILATMVATAENGGEEPLKPGGHFTAKPVIDQFLADGFITGYRIATPDGRIVLSNDKDEIGIFLPAQTVAAATHGPIHRGDVDEARDVPLVNGAVIGYRPVLNSDRQVVGLVGTAISRGKFARTSYQIIWVGYRWVVALTLLFGGAGIEFLRRHLVARHNLQARLVQTLGDLELAEEVANIGYWSVDGKTGEVIWSDHMYDVFGEDPETFIPTRGYYEQVIDPAFREKSISALDRALTDHTPADIETRIIRPDGSKRDLLVALRPRLSAGGERMNLFGIVADITVRKDAQRALEERERELAEAISATEAAVWNWDIPTNVFQTSPQLAQILGLDGSLAKTSFDDLRERTHPDDVEASDAAIRAHLLDRTPFNIEFRLRHANGAYVWVHSRGRIADWDGVKPVRMIGTMTDISRRRAAEDALRRSQETLKLALEAADAGYFTTDFNKKEFYLSPRVHEMLDLPPQFKMTPQTFAPLLHPDDALHFKSMVDDLVAFTPSEYQFRVKQTSGRYVWVHIKAIVERDADRNPIRSIGFIQDVTARREAAEALTASEERFRLLTENASDIISLRDQDGVLRYISPSVAKATGYTPEEFVGNTGAFLIHPGDRRFPRGFRDGVLTSAISNKLRRYRIHRKEGTLAWLESHDTVIPGRDGRPMVLSVTRDITENIAAQDALHESESRFRLLADNAADVISVFNQDNIFTYISPSIERLTGYKPEEVIGQKATDGFFSSDVSEPAGSGAGAESGKGLRRRVHVQRKDGTYVWVEALYHTTPTPDGGFETHSVARDITESVVAQEALRESENRFRLLANNAADVIAVVNQDNIFTYVSPSIERLTGYKPEEVIGRNAAGGGFNTEQDGQTIAAIQGEGETEYRRRLRIQRRDGTYIWVETIYQRIPTADGGFETHSVARDITESVVAQEALRESESRFRLLADNAADVIAVQDENSTFTYVSPSIERLTGYKPEEVIGQRNGTAFFKVRQELVDSPVPGDAETVFRRRYNIRRKDGRYIWVESTFQHHPTPNGKRETHSVLRDITERVEYEQELRTTRDRFQKQAMELAMLAQNLEVERERAEKANAAKSQFLAMMSHELRTPMTGILGIADLLQLSELNTEQGSLLRRLNRSAQVLLDLLNDVLDFSKIEAQQLLIESTPFRLTDVVADIENLFMPIASEKGVTLSVTRPPVFHDAVIGDAKRLRQILVNLIGNAIKFTERGTVNVRLVQDVTTDHRACLKVDVTDSGIGISDDQMKLLFQPFVQADVSTSRKYGGTGLGLAITRRLVEAMGGTISVTSDLGSGSTFSFTITHAIDPNPVPTAPASPLRAISSLPTPVGRGRRVLVAEDNETSRFLVATMLGKWGYIVDTVENGQEAVDAFAAKKYDIALMDMQMPVMDGSEAIVIMRAAEHNGDRMPIIALTADLVGAHQKAFLAAGADAVVPKPVNWDALTTTMERLMGKSPENAPAVAEAAVAPAQEILNTATLTELGEILGAAGLDSMVARFLESAAKYRGDVEACVKDGKLREAKRAAHALKGLCAQFGAIEVTAVAKNIEEKSTSIEEISALLPRLEISIKQTEAALAAHFAKTLVS